MFGLRPQTRLVVGPFRQTILRKPPNQHVHTVLAEEWLSLKYKQRDAGVLAGVVFLTLGVAVNQVLVFCRVRLHVLDKSIGVDASQLDCLFNILVVFFLTFEIQSNLSRSDKFILHA